MTQKLLCISPAIIVNKTLSISKWKFTIGLLTSNISIIKFDADGALELSDFFDFLEKDSSSSLDRIMLERA